MIAGPDAAKFEVLQDRSCVGRAVAIPADNTAVKRPARISCVGFMAMWGTECHCIPIDASQRKTGPRRVLKNSGDRSLTVAARFRR